MIRDIRSKAGSECVYAMDDEILPSRKVSRATSFKGPPMWKTTFIYRPTMHIHTTYKRIREVELPVGPQLDKSDRSMEKQDEIRRQI